MNIERYKKWLFGILGLAFFVIVVISSDRVINLKALLGFSIFVFSGYLFLRLIYFKSVSASLLRAFIYSSIVGMSLWASLLFIVGSLGIRVYDWQLYGLSFAILAGTIYVFHKDKSIFKQIKKSAGSWDSIITFFILDLLLIVSFLPSNGLLTAPLHDPAQNSVVAARLMDGNFLYSSIPYLTSHYPPGAAYIIAAFASLTGIDGPKATLILTISASILGVLSLKVFAEKYFDNKRFTNIIFVVSSVLFPYILGLYSIVGKNSQIFAYSFLFVSLCIFYESIREKLSCKILLGLVISVSVLVHYTNAFIFAAFALIILIIEVLHKKLKWKEVTKTFFPFLMTGALVLVIALLQYRNIMDIPGVSHLTNYTINSFGELSAGNFFRYLTEPPANTFQRLNLVFPIILSIVYMTILIASIYEYIRHKKTDKLKLFSLLIPVAFIPVYLFGPFNVSYFSNYHVFFFVTVILSMALYYFFYLKPKKSLKVVNKFVRYLAVILLIGYSAFAMYWLHRTNIIARKLTAVDNSDLKAFEWIDRNIAKDDYILPSAVFGFEINQNFEADGLLYLKAYTKNEEIFGFVQGDKFAGSNELYDEYLILSKDITNREAIDAFLDRNVRYVYVDSDSPLGEEYLDPENFALYPLIYKEVYSLEGIRVYEIIPQ